jgi:O-antigen ligase
MLLLAVIIAIQRDSALADRLGRMLVVGAAGAAALNVQRVVAAAIRTDEPLSSFARIFGTVRVNIHYADLNAAGSYFALILPVAVALFVARPTRAVGWGLAAALIAAALWLTGARAAIAASVSVLLATSILLALRRSRAFRALPVGLALLGSCAVLLAAPAQIFRGNAREALMLRAELTRTSMRMFKNDPVFGVGVGGYYYRSGAFMSERLRTYYSRENAHNQFLQVLAELGLTGFVPFVWTLLAAGVRGARTRSGALSAWY